MCSWLFNKYIKCTEIGKKDLLICRVVTPKYMFNKKRKLSEVYVCQNLFQSNRQIICI